VKAEQFSDRGQNRFTATAFALDGIHFVCHVVMDCEPRCRFLFANQTMNDRRLPITDRATEGARNSTTWINARFAPLTVVDAPHSAPQEGQILVCNQVVAVNPVDRYKQGPGNRLYGWTSIRSSAL
jgi:hypothetical protein